MLNYKCQFLTCLILGQLLHDSNAETDTTTLAAPIVATPSEAWEGNDGSWSTFEIRVGTPQQNFRVLPVTSWQETWVIWALDADCNTAQGVPQKCSSIRGGGFNNTASSTFQAENEFALDLNTDLGYTGGALYGFDTVGLGFTNSTGPTLSHQIVAAIESQTWYFGILGMGFQPTNFSGFGDPQASFADTLVSNDSISSMTWSYTAGAFYRLKGAIFGQAIFGGYDASRFTPNNLTFEMAGDDIRDLVLSLQSITSNTSMGSVTLMSTSELMFIDSSVPEIWLPLDVCQQFEQAFGIKLDPISERYLLNASTHAALVAQNPTFTFALANNPLPAATFNASNTLDITIPYQAFDLNVSAPIVANTTSYYFPIRRASNSSQYTIGRSFLQEAYITANYNTRTFNVSQCIFENSLSPNVIAIPSVLPATTPSNNTSSSTHHALSTGAIAGIAITATLILLLILACMIFHLRRHHSPKNPQSSSPQTSLIISNHTPIHEIDAGTRVQFDSEGNTTNLSAYHEQASKLAQELHGRDKIPAMQEIGGNPIMHPQELEADAVPGVYFQGRGNREEGEGSEVGNIDADNPDSGTSGTEDLHGGTLNQNSRNRNMESKGESSGEEGGNTVVSSLSPSPPRAGFVAGGRGRGYNFSRPLYSGDGGGNPFGLSGLLPSTEVSTDEENSGVRGSGEETDHLVSPLTDRGSMMGRGRPGTWGTVASSGQGVSSPVSEES